MIKAMSLILTISMFSNIAFADCDFSTEVNKLPDGNYEYSKSCHLTVGGLVQDKQKLSLQLDDLTKALSFKDLALKASDDRTQLWMDTTFKLEKNINAMDEFKKTNEWLYFGLGILTVVATGFALSSITSRR